MANNLPRELSPLSRSPTQAWAYDQADDSDRIALCEGIAVVAGEEVVLDPRALYRGGLARWIPSWKYPLRGPMHEGVQMVDAKENAIMEVERVGVCQRCGIRT